MIPREVAVKTAEKVAARDAAAAESVRAKLAAAQPDPHRREAAERLAATRYQAGWEALAKAITEKIVETEEKYRVESMALAEGRPPVVFQAGHPPQAMRVSLDEGIRLAHIRLAELRGWDAALEWVTAQVPKETEGEK